MKKLLLLSLLGFASTQAPITLYINEVIDDGNGNATLKLFMANSVPIAGFQIALETDFGFLLMCLL